MGCLLLPAVSPSSGCCSGEEAESLSVLTLRDTQGSQLALGHTGTTLAVNSHPESSLLASVSPRHTNMTASRVPQEAWARLTPLLQLWKEGSFLNKGHRECSPPRESAPQLRKKNT